MSHSYAINLSIDIELQRKCLIQLNKLMKIKLYQKPKSGNFSLNRFFITLHFNKSYLLKSIFLYIELLSKIKIKLDSSLINLIFEEIHTR